jgi:hypothetical protein
MMRPFFPVFYEDLYPAVFAPQDTDKPVCIVIMVKQDSRAGNAIRCVHHSME